MKKYICIIGSTSGLGYSIAEILAKNEKNRLLLISRNLTKLEKIRRDLVKRYGTEIEILQCDLSKFKASDFKKAFLRIKVKIDELYCVAGYTSNQDTVGTNTKEVHKIFSINSLSYISILNMLSKSNLSKDAKIVIISSVACIRPRSVNMIYSASKLALESYTQSLRHQFTDKKIYIFRMGYMKTKMLSSKKIILPAIHPDKAAKKILFAINSKSDGFYYIPSWWFLVSLGLKATPWWIFKKLRV